MLCEETTSDFIDRHRPGIDAPGDHYGLGFPATALRASWSPTDRSQEETGSPAADAAASRASRSAWVTQTLRIASFRSAAAFRRLILRMGL